MVRARRGSSRPATAMLVRMDPSLSLAGRRVWSPAGRVGVYGGCRVRGYWLDARTQGDGGGGVYSGRRDGSRDSVGLRVRPDSREVQFMAASAMLCWRIRILVARRT